MNQRLKLTATNTILILTLCTCDLRNTDFKISTEVKSESTANFFDPASLFDAETKAASSLLKKPVKVSGIGAPKQVKGLNPAYFDLIGKPEEINELASLTETGED